VRHIGQRIGRHLATDNLHKLCSNWDNSLWGFWYCKKTPFAMVPWVEHKNLNDIHILKVVRLHLQDFEHFVVHCGVRLMWVCRYTHEDRWLNIYDSCTIVGQSVLSVQNYPEDKRNTTLWNVGKQPPDFMVQLNIFGIFCLLGRMNAGLTYSRFIAICYTFKLPTCIQEPLVIGRRTVGYREL